MAFSAFSVEDSEEPQFEQTAPAVEDAFSAQSEDWGVPQQIRQGKGAIDFRPTSQSA